MSHSIHPDMYQDHIAKGRPTPLQEHLDSAKAEADTRAAINYLVLKGVPYKDAEQIVGEKGAAAILAEREG